MYFSSVLLIGGSLWAGKELSKKFRTQNTSLATLLTLDSQSQPLDSRYQGFFQTRIDPLFGIKQRGQQLHEFSGAYTEKEAETNRRLGLAVVNANLAILGAVVYQPLSWLSALGVIYIMWPIVHRNLRILIREKRLKYRLVATLSIYTGLAAGYFVVSSLMAVFVFLAYKVAARTEAQSYSAIRNTFTAQPPDSVWLRVGEIETAISFVELKVGDIIVLTAGQTVPIDGLIVEGMASIDQHILTGESQPVEKIPLDRVFANTIVLTGKVYVRVEKTGEDTAAAQIGKILGNINFHQLEHEARSEQLADKLTLPVLAASSLALLTVGDGGATAILNSGFGSTLFISGPLSMLSHLNLASHHGILVKDGRSLETLHDVDTVVFDKTGTLTTGQPELCAIHCCAGWQEEQVLVNAARAEYRQSHPVAKAILTAAEQYSLDFAIPESVAYTVGFGVQVWHQGINIQVGSQRFMEHSQITIPANINAAQSLCKETGNSLIMVAMDGQLVGALELQSQLRPKTVELIGKLHQRGLKLCILSGDHRQPTQNLAQRLNIDDFFAEVLPEGKSDVIRQLQQAGRKVCFVGDGINDAIALQQADVSVSLRGATSVATDSAQIILMNQTLQQLDQLFEIAHGFNKNLDQTMRLAYIPGCVLIGGVFLFHFGMPAALLLYGSGVTAAISKALSPLWNLQKGTEIIN